MGAAQRPLEEDQCLRRRVRGGDGVWEGLPDPTPASQGQTSTAADDEGDDGEVELVGEDDDRPEGHASELLAPQVMWGASGNPVLWRRWDGEHGFLVAFRPQAAYQQILKRALGLAGPPFPNCLYCKEPPPPPLPPIALSLTRMSGADVLTLHEL